MLSRRLFVLSSLLLLLLGCASPFVTTVTPTATPGSRINIDIPYPDEPPPARTPTTAPATTAAPPAITAAVTAAAQPSATSAAALPTAAPGTNPLADRAALDATLLPRRDAVQLAVDYGRTDSLERTVSVRPPDRNVGDREEFVLTDIPNNRYYTTTAILVVALEHVLMYVEEGLSVDEAALERSAREFNDTIYDFNRQTFGEEWSPGVDGDPRLTVLNARIPGVGGYFSGSDELPRAVNRYSNEREMFYINVDDRRPGTPGYASVLAHEFQHMIEWYQSQRPTTWMNEGLSQLAEDLNGFDGGGPARSYVANPDLQLTAWASTPSQSLPHYGASYLFVSYFYEQYRDVLDLKALIRDGAGERLDLFAAQASKRRADVDSFEKLFADWAVANVLNDPQVGDGRYSYGKLPFTVDTSNIPGGGLSDDVAQWGADYIELPSRNKAQTVSFDGSETVQLFAAPPEGGAWWSRRGDNSASVLTHTFDLRNVPAATLRFRLWYDIEPDYDYGFVSASTDGENWTTLRGRYTTDNDPLGGNYGNGYTALSGEGGPKWVDEQIDLSAFAGKELILRFSLITDDAYNAPGMVIDDIRIPEINFSDNADQGDGWTAGGWVRTDNRLPQQWALRLVRFGSTGVTVEPLMPDELGRAQAQLAPGERAILVIAAATPHTTERAEYTLTAN